MYIQMYMYLCLRLYDLLHNRVVSIFVLEQKSGEKTQSYINSIFFSFLNQLLLWALSFFFIENFCHLSLEKLSENVRQLRLHLIWLVNKALFHFILIMLPKRTATRRKTIKNMVEFALICQPQLCQPTVTLPDNITL